MLSGLGHSAPEDGDNDTHGGDMMGAANGASNDRADADEDDADGEDADQQNKKSRAKKRRMKKSSQIAENLDTITSKLRDDFVDVTFLLLRTMT